MQSKHFFVIILILFAFTNCKSVKNKSLEYKSINDFAQGSTYSITYSSPSNNYNVPDSVTKYLRQIDLSISGYNKESILSAINRGENVPLDNIFIDIFNKSYEIYKKSNGYFDVSAGPLFNLWGFGFKNGDTITQVAIDSLKQFIGMDKVRIIKDSTSSPTCIKYFLQKDDPRIQLNFNAIAQGYSCDYIAQKFELMGIENYLIEIGGEIYCKGKNAKGTEWKIGIDKPIDGNNIPGENLECIILLSNKGLVTSGNYRKFYVKEGKKYSHTIDPISGYPVSHSLLSATVVAEDATIADAFATYFMVIGLDKSKEILNSDKSLQAILVYGDGDNDNMKTYSTDLIKLYKNEQ